MAINLQKGQTINLDKDTNDLSSITIGLGWKIKKKEIKKQPGFFASLFGGGSGNDDGEEYDLDAIAFMLNGQGKIGNFGHERFVGSDVIFFNNLSHPSGHVIHTGDNLVGGAGVQDDEQIIVKLNTLSPQYDRILFIVSIYQGIKKRQHFGNVEGAFMRAVDARGTEIARYNLAEDSAYENMRTVTFGEVYRKGAGWKFRAIGDAYPTDSFANLLAQYS